MKSMWSFCFLFMQVISPPRNLLGLSSFLEMLFNDIEQIEHVDSLDL